MAGFHGCDAKNLRGERVDLALRAQSLGHGFIEETPNVPIEKEFPQAPLQMPEGLGATKKYREIADFDELVARARGAPQ